MFWSSRTLQRKKRYFSKNETDETENRSVRDEESELSHPHTNNTEHGLPLERIVLKCWLLMN